MHHSLVNWTLGWATDLIAFFVRMYLVANYFLKPSPFQVSTPLPPIWPLGLSFLAQIPSCCSPHRTWSDLLITAAMFWHLPSGVASISWRPQERWLLFWLPHCVFTSWVVPPYIGLLLLWHASGHFRAILFAAASAWSCPLCLQSFPTCFGMAAVVNAGHWIAWSSFLYFEYWLMPLIWALGILRHNRSWVQDHFWVHGELEACSTLDCLRKHKQNSFPEI